ncbi:putative phosphatase [Rhodococcus sp. MTM3W5.2]|nr:putative phosphatase [Rhodococcus sp. MTM3W5.2]
MLIDSYGGYREVWSRWCAMRSVPLEMTWAATHGRRPVETIAEVAPHLDPAEEYGVLRQLMRGIGDQFQAFPAAAPLRGPGDQATIERIPAPPPRDVVPTRQAVR